MQERAIRSPHMDLGEKPGTHTPIDAAAVARQEARRQRNQLISDIRNIVQIRVALGRGAQHPQFTTYDDQVIHTSLVRQGGRVDNPPLLASHFEATTESGPRADGAIREDALYATTQAGQPRALRVVEYEYGNEHGIRIEGSTQLGPDGQPQWDSHPEVVEECVDYFQPVGVRGSYIFDTYLDGQHDGSVLEPANA